MHIDLNSCFATVEQQANPLLRDKPIVVVYSTSPNGCVLSPSIEAKQFGIKTGTTVREARLLCSQVIIRLSDPPKYRDVHLKFRKIFSDYSSSVTPKSIDEAIIDFTNMNLAESKLIEIAKEIKYRMRTEIGEWISCSIGISTNRFLAKMGASLHKPDGLDVVDHKNVIDMYKHLTLLDLHGINTCYQARLNTYGIFTPLQFFNATEECLHKQVFKSIVGYYWYLKLHGWETDAIDFTRKSYGQQYALYHPTGDPVQLSRMLMKLSEKMGRRLRRSGNAAGGIHIACVYKDHTYWHQGRKVNTPMYTTQELYRNAQWMLNKQPEKKVVTRLGVSCYDLAPSKSSQMNLFDTDPDRLKNVSDAMDVINDRYGEYVITPALMMNMDHDVKDAVAFGGVRELNDLY